MVCPNCLTQMNQKDYIGGGQSGDDLYETWMVLECPQCERLVLESYSAEVIDKDKMYQDLKNE